MPNITIPPLIPLPEDHPQTRGDAKEDLFATLFSPATPRSSPAVSPPPEEKSKSKHASRHSRGSSSASTDSEFGSFVSVPSAEDPLSQFVSASSSVPFTPLQNFGFFEDARGTQTQEKASKGVLDELLRNENDPLFFLRDGVLFSVRWESASGMTPYVRLGRYTARRTTRILEGCVASGL